MQFRSSRRLLAGGKDKNLPGRNNYKIKALECVKCLLNGHKPPGSAPSHCTGRAWRRTSIILALRLEGILGYIDSLGPAWDTWGLVWKPSEVKQRWKDSSSPGEHCLQTYCVQCTLASSLAVSGNYWVLRYVWMIRYIWWALLCSNARQ